VGLKDLPGELVKGMQMRPTKKEALARLLVLKHVVVYAMSAPDRPDAKGLFGRWFSKEVREYDKMCRTIGDAVLTMMKEDGLMRYSTPIEQEFLEGFGSGMREYSRVAAGWRAEGMAMLRWALGDFTEWPSLEKVFGPEIVGDLPSGREALDTGPDLRSEEEINKKRDLIELWHWRVTTRRCIEEGYSFNFPEEMKQKGFGSFDDVVRFIAKEALKTGQLPEIRDEDFVYLGKPFRDLPEDEYNQAASIIMERHYALNWLCGYAPGNRWDETPTDT